ncbi:MAG: hypothetical protein ABJH98_04105 [Reichenbachiella sp.]|uniref:hypothetical protein n=1 Tax=Reichenbachiella sp. TaxID=2184521 RepID=UPI003297E235
MKRFICVISALFILSIAHQSFGQLEKGTFLVGGSMDFGKVDGEYSKSNSYLAQSGISSKIFNFNISPDVSYLVIDRLSIGIMLPTSYRIEEFDGDKTKRFKFSIEPRIRYYIPFGNWALFPELSYAIGKEYSRADFYSPLTGDFIEDKKLVANSNKFSFGVGLSYFITKNVGLEGTVYIDKSENKYDEDDGRLDGDITSAGFRVGLQIYLANKE